MTLKELAVEYRQSAQLLRERLRDLRQAHKLAESADERWKLKRRILDLTPLLTQTNKVADLLEHYYDRGYYRNAEYSANAFGTYFPATIRKPAQDHSKRVDTCPAGYAYCLPDKGRITERVRRADGCEQINSKPQSAESDEKIAALHSVLIDSSPAVLERLFPQIKKETEKNEN